jgi:hypothetical protein
MSAAAPVTRAAVPEKTLPAFPMLMASDPAPYYRTVVAQVPDRLSTTLPGHDRDEAETFAPDAFHDRGQGGNRGGAVPAAVVEDHDRSRPDC